MAENYVSVLVEQICYVFQNFGRPLRRFLLSLSPLNTQSLYYKYSSFLVPVCARREYRINVVARAESEILSFHIRFMLLWSGTHSSSIRVLVCASSNHTADIAISTWKAEDWVGSKVGRVPACLLPAAKYAGLLQFGQICVNWN